jgi:hypothetical protein
MQFSGRALLLDCDLSDSFDIEIGKVVFRRNGISFDWIFDGEVAECVRLTSLDGIVFNGTTTNSPGTTWESTSRVEGVLYSNAKGHILVAQTELLDGEDESWFVQLSDGKAVPD